jgi:hypothetical protein
MQRPSPELEQVISLGRKVRKVLKPDSPAPVPGTGYRAPAARDFLVRPFFVG